MKETMHKKWVASRKQWEEGCRLLDAAKAKMERAGTEANAASFEESLMSSSFTLQGSKTPPTTMGSAASPSRPSRLTSGGSSLIHAGDQYNDQEVNVADYGTRAAVQDGSASPRRRRTQKKPPNLRAEVVEDGSAVPHPLYTFMQHQQNSAENVYSDVPGGLTQEKLREIGKNYPSNENHSQLFERSEGTEDGKNGAASAVESEATQMPPVKQFFELIQSKIPVSVATIRSPSPVHGHQEMAGPVYAPTINISGAPDKNHGQMRTWQGESPTALSKYLSSNDKVWAVHQHKSYKRQLQDGDGGTVGDDYGVHDNLNIWRTTALGRGLELARSSTLILPFILYSHFILFPCTDGWFYVYSLHVLTKPVHYTCSWVDQLLKLGRSSGLRG